ncbi:MAG: leucine-rich repeat protein [Eubacterium sp.]
MKKVISLFLSIIMLISTFACADLSVYAQINTGVCGDKATFSFDTTTGLLTISGTGDMYDYWSGPFRDKINISDVKSVVINSGITSIGSFSFSDCINLNNISIPDSVTNIGWFAFSNCSSLTEITIPANVTEIGFISVNDAFSECYSLASINVSSSNQEYSSVDGVLFNKNQTTLYCCPIAYSKSTYIIPSTVSKIESSAFENCKKLTSVTISENVSKVGIKAFASTSVENIDVVSSNTNYTSINGVLLSKDKTSLYAYPIGNKQTSYTIPNTVTFIEEYAFKGCENIISLTLGESQSIIDELSFSEMHGLNDLYFTSNIKSIEDNAFMDCDSLKSIVIPKSVENIGYGAFAGCDSLEYAEVSGSVETIDERIFANCENLQSAKLSGLITVSNYMFEGCGKLNSVILADTIVEIGKGAFLESGLTSITIPNSVQVIGDSAFWESGLTSITIPNSVQVIGDHAFSFSNLTDVIIPDSVISLGKSVFYECDNLINAKIGNGITSISGLFYECDNLSTVTIGNKVSDIGSLTFGCCPKLKTVSFGNGVKYIDSQAFEGSDNIKDVYYSGTKSQWNLIDFDGYQSNVDLSEATIHCSDGTIVPDYDDDDECIMHKWNSGTVTKKATTSSAGTKKYTCTVCGETKTSSIAKIKSVTLSKTSYTYDSKAKKPTVTVKDSNGKTISSSNYTVTYASGRKNIGSYKVTVKFKGNYSGTVTKTFKIVPKGTSVTSVESKKPGQLTVKWKKQSSNTTGYVVRISKNSDLSNAASYTIKNKSTTSKTITGLADGTKYYVQVCTYKTVNKKSYDSSWSSSKSATVKVTPATLKSVESNPEAFTVHINKPSKSVTGYVVQYSTDKNFKSSAKTKDISNNTVYTITGLKPQTKYYVRVKTYKTVNGVKKYSSYSKSLTALTRLKYPKNINVINSSSTSLKISWDKVSGAKGYEIYRSTSKNGTYKKIKTISKGTTTSYTDKNLKTLTTYYYRIVALSSKDKKANSIKSSAYSCKTKYPVSSYFKISVKNDTYIYTGADIKPEPVVINSKTAKKLKKDTDYTLSYSNNKNTGKATIIITGKGNYYGTKKVNFTINPKPLQANDITVSGTNNVNGIYYPATVKYGNITLKNGTDYTFGAPVCINEFSNSVKIILKGNYTNTVEKTYMVIPNIGEDKINLIKKTYPQNSYWGPEYYDEYLGYGCYAFAQACHKLAFGNLAEQKYNNMNFDSIKVGDMVHFANDQGTEHWVFVLAKGPDYLCVAGGNEYIESTKQYNRVNYYTIEKSKINSRIYANDSLRR